MLLMCPARADSRHLESSAFLGGLFPRPLPPSRIPASRTEHKTPPSATGGVLALRGRGGPDRRDVRLLRHDVRKFRILVASSKALSAVSGVPLRFGGCRGKHARPTFSSSFFLDQVALHRRSDAVNFCRPPPASRLSSGVVCVYRLAPPRAIPLLNLFGVCCQHRVTPCPRVSSFQVQEC